MGTRLEPGKSHHELRITLSAVGLEEEQAQLQQAALILEDLGMEGDLENAQAALADR
jgi:hypothetical protein